MTRDTLKNTLAPTCRSEREGHTLGMHLQCQAAHVVGQAHGFDRVWCVLLQAGPGLQHGEGRGRRGAGAVRGELDVEQAVARGGGRLPAEDLAAPSAVRVAPGLLQARCC